MSTRRMVVVGGDAAGMSAAATAKRRGGDDLEVVVFERGRWTSYSACGIPYWVGGEVPSPHDLVARTPEEHRRRGIDVRMGVEVIELEPDAGTVRVRDADGVQSGHSYDELVLATGAEPNRPDLPGVDAAGVHLVHTLDDGQRVLTDLDRAAPRRAVVVGGGYIGLEMAESFVHRGIDTTMLMKGEAPMATLDHDVGMRLREAMESDGIDVRGSSPARGFVTTGGRVSGVETDHGMIPADIVVLGVGIHPRSRLATNAGLATGASAGIVVDSRQRVDPARRIWAGGDCVETYNRVSGGRVYVPLGTHANKHGVVIGRNVSGDDIEFPGVLSTAITKVCSTEISRTGLGEQDAADAGFHPEAVTIETTTRSGYYPGAAPMSVKLVADRTSRRVLGAQILGGSGAAKRIDAVAMALWSESTVDDLMFADLSYAPPFSGVWDPVQVAARSLVSRLG